MQAHWRFPRGSRQGFSLMEVLLSIVIMTVLIAMVSVGTTYVFRTADQAKCMVNLRSIYGGVISYAVDHDGQLPGATPGSQPYRYRSLDNTLEVRPLVNLLIPYLGLPVSPSPREWLEAPMFQCPSRVRRQETDHHFGQYRTFWQGKLYDRPLGYGNQTVGTTERPPKLATFETPAAIILLGDRTIAGTDEAHGSSRSMIFMDGHVELIPSTSFQRRTMESWEIIR